MASVLNSHNLTIVRCIQFKKCLCFKLKYVHFVYSYIVYVAFPSCLCCDDQFVVFTLCYFSSSQGAWGHATVMVNDPFSDLPFFGSEESIWSEITNPFLDSPTKVQPYLLCTFWKRVRWEDTCSFELANLFGPSSCSLAAGPEYKMNELRSLSRQLCCNESVLVFEGAWLRRILMFCHLNLFLFHPFQRDWPFDDYHFVWMFML